MNIKLYMRTYDEHHVGELSAKWRDVSDSPSLGLPPQ